MLALLGRVEVVEFQVGYHVDRGQVGNVSRQDGDVHTSDEQDFPNEAHWDDSFQG